MKPVGLLYTNPKLIKHLKKFIKAKTKIEWKDVYNIGIVELDSLTPGTPGAMVIVIAGSNFERLSEIGISDVFPVGWDK